MRRADKECMAALELLENLLREKGSITQQDGHVRKVTNLELLLLTLRKKAVEGNASAFDLLSWTREALPRALAAAAGKENAGERFKGGICLVPKEVWTKNLSVDLAKIPSSLDADGD